MGVCKQKAISFSAPKASKKENAEIKTDKSRRQFFIALGVAGTAATARAMAKNPLADKKNVQRQQPIAPPGSVSAKHLNSKCTSCHLCVSKCPSHVIKPALTEYGLAGIMQPLLSFENGFCNYDCTVCSDVCPSDAIKPLRLDEKHVTQMGQVRFVRENCVVYRDETSCGACSEHCPTQAVSMVSYKGGLTIPQTDTNICVGCGGCEFICPARPKAIYVEGLAVQNTIELKLEEREKVEVDDFGF
jgi:ferredoxin